MSTHRFRRSSEDDGAVLVEFALVISLFFLLVFGMIDFGLAINTKTQMTNAGREGARLGTVSTDPDPGTAVVDRVKEAADNLDQTILSVTVVCQKPDDTPCPPTGDLKDASAGDSVIVTVDYTYDMITPLPGFIGSGGDIALKSVTEMRVEK